MNASPKLTAEQLTELNQHLETLPPREIIQWAHSVFGKRLGLLSAMQEAGCLLCATIASMGLQREVDVLFVDTGVNFKETYETLERLKATYGLNIRSLHPAQTMAEQTRDLGVLYITPDGQKRCCEIRKKVPLQQIVGQYDGLLASLRRGSGGKRAKTPVLEIDRELNLLRIHPFINLTREEMEQQIRSGNVVTNPLHQQGYPTIGCDRCTTPVLDGEDERAGRWRHLENANVYCNINPTDRKRTDQGDPEEEGIILPAEVMARILSFDI